MARAVALIALAATIAAGGVLHAHAARPIASSGAVSEAAARWLFIIGVVALLGGTVASAARFGGSRDRTLASIGAAIALAGVVLLAVAQASNAHAPLARVLTTVTGR